MVQLVSLAGSLLILAAYVASQRSWLRPQQRSYVLLNFVGAAVLATVAILERQWGFLVLEGAWTLVSAYSLVRPPPAPAPAATA
jgi:hypothetical protein